MLAMWTGRWYHERASTKMQGTSSIWRRRRAAGRLRRIAKGDAAERARGLHASTAQDGPAQGRPGFGAFIASRRDLDLRGVQDPANDHYVTAVIVFSTWKRCMRRTGAQVHETTTSSR